MESIKNWALHRHYIKSFTSNNASFIFLLLIIYLMVSLHYSGSFVCLFGYPENMRIFVFLLNLSNVNIFLVTYSPTDITSSCNE